MAVMLEKYEICCGLFHGFDWSAWTTGTPSGTAALLPAAQEHILAQEDGKNRLGQGRDASCRRPSRWRCRMSEALAHPRRRGVLPGGEGGSGQASAAARRDRRGTRSRHPADRVARRWRPTGVIDIFAAAGLKKPDISILSDEFLAEVRGMPQRNLAVELLQKAAEGRNQDARRARTSFRRGRSRRCWSGRCGDIRTAPSRPRR